MKKSLHLIRNTLPTSTVLLQYNCSFKFESLKDCNVIGFVDVQKIDI